MSDIDLGWKLLLYGIGGTFIALIIFYFVIKIMVALVKGSQKRKANKAEE